MWRQNSERGSACEANLRGSGRPSPHNGFRLLQRDTMVVLRSSLELHSRSTDSLDLSSEFLSLQDSGRRRSGSTRGAEKSLVPTAAAAAGVSTGLGPAPLGALGVGAAPRAPAA